jgi:hypothetical protein
MVPTAWLDESVTVVAVTLVMRPYCTLDWASAGDGISARVAAAAAIETWAKRVRRMVWLLV